MLNKCTRAQRDRIEDAAKARTDLFIFSALQTLLEQSLISSLSNRSAARIVAICKFEQQQCLRRYDAAIEKAGGAPYGKFDEQ